jgi:hypothetical protein
MTCAPCLPIHATNFFSFFLPSPQSPFTSCHNPSPLRCHLPSYSTRTRNNNNRGRRRLGPPPCPPTRLNRTCLPSVSASVPRPHRRALQRLPAPSSVMPFSAHRIQRDSATHCHHRHRVHRSLTRHPRLPTIVSSIPKPQALISKSHNIDN